MKKCEKCNSPIEENVGQLFDFKTLCEDCYIDKVMPRMSKSYYNNNSEFMNRLKDSYPVRKQQFF